MSDSVNSINPIEVTFWGVRGSKPSPGKHTIHFGGNTACVQIQIANRLIILDAGTGIVELGNYLKATNDQKQGASIKGDIFFSHYHWDHIQGFPFFQPFFQEGNCFSLYGEHKLSMSIEEILAAQMRSPYFPINMKEMKATFSFHEMSNEKTINLGDGISVTAFSVNHPNGCLAYRLDYRSCSVLYCTDTEPMPSHKLEDFYSYIQEIDVLIMDSHFQLEEFHGLTDGISKLGWGHGTWEDSAKLSNDAKVDTLVLFHHMESRTDEELLLIEKKATSIFPKTVAAREGMKLLIGGHSAEKVKIHYP